MNLFAGLSVLKMWNTVMLLELDSVEFCKSHCKFLLAITALVTQVSFMCLTLHTIPMFLYVNFFFVICIGLYRRTNILYTWSLIIFWPKFCILTNRSDLPNKIRFWCFTLFFYYRGLQFKFSEHDCDVFGWAELPGWPTIVLFIEQVTKVSQKGYDLVSARV